MATIVASLHSPVVLLVPKPLPILRQRALDNPFLQFRINLPAELLRSGRNNARKYDIRDGQAEQQYGAEIIRPNCGERCAYRIAR